MKNQVLPDPICFVCTVWVSSQGRIFPLPNPCACPYPHTEPTRFLPGTGPAIDHGRPNPFL